MIKYNPITKAIDILGLQGTADICDVTYQAVQQWERVGMPRTEWTGETHYSKLIEKHTEGYVKRLTILSWSSDLKKNRKKPAKSYR